MDPATIIAGVGAAIKIAEAFGLTDAKNWQEQFDRLAPLGEVVLDQIEEIGLAVFEGLHIHTARHQVHLRAGDKNPHIPGRFPTPILAAIILASSLVLSSCSSRVVKVSDHPYKQPYYSVIWPNDADRDISHYVTAPDEETGEMVTTAPIEKIVAIELPGVVLDETDYEDPTMELMIRANDAGDGLK